jgi:flagellar biosynthesis/type III secretory pathway protein FliH
VLRTRRRHGDAAEMSIVALLEPAPAAKAAEKGEKASAQEGGRAKKAPRRRPEAPEEGRQKAREEGRAQEEVRQVRED